MELISIHHIDLEKHLDMVEQWNMLAVYFYLQPNIQYFML